MKKFLQVIKEYFYIMLFIVVLLLGFSVNRSYGAGLPTQNTFNAQVVSVTNSWLQILGVGYNGTALYYNIYVSSTVSDFATTTFLLSVGHCDSFTFPDGGSSSGCVTDFNNVSETITLGSSPAWYTITLPSALVFNNTKYYYTNISSVQNSVGSGFYNAGACGSVNCYTEGATGGSYGGSSINSGGDGYVPAFYFSAGVLAPSINFIVPVDGTTTVPFDYLSVGFSNLNNTSTYKVSEYTTYTGCFLLVFGVCSEKEIDGVQFGGTGEKLIRFGYSTPFPFPQDVTPLSQFSMVSNVKLYDITSSNSILVASKTIQWYMIPYAHDGLNGANGTTTIWHNYPVWVQATSTEPVTTPWDGSVSQSRSTSTESNIGALCPPADSLTDVGGGVRYAICSGFKVIFDPSVVPIANNFFKDEVDKLKQDPPFSALFDVASSVEAGVNNVSTTYDGVSIGILGFNNEQRILVSVNSTTFYQGFASSNNSSTAHSSMEYLHHFISSWLWIGASIKLLIIFLT